MEVIVLKSFKNQFFIFFNLHCGSDWLVFWFPFQKFEVANNLSDVLISAITTVPSMAFSITGSSTTLAGSVVETACSTDWITIPCATNTMDSNVQSGTPPVCVDRICGMVFNSVTTPSGSPSTSVNSKSHFLKTCNIKEGKSAFLTTKLLYNWFGGIKKLHAPAFDKPQTAFLSFTFNLFAWLTTVNVINELGTKMNGCIIKL